MMSYHRQYIPQYAAIAKPLTDITSVKYAKNFQWLEVHEQAFVALKEQLLCLVAVSVPRIGGLFILRTDASNFAVSGCLYQMQDDNIANVDVAGNGEKPISFFSKKLSSTQCTWSVIEREAYAVIASLNKFFNVVYGSQLVIFSDHNPLSFLIDNVTQSPRLTRWCLALQCFNIVFRYAKASNNKVADYFSRYSLAADGSGA